MTVLVLGAAGFLGRHLLSALTDAGKSVVAYDRCGMLARLPQGAQAEIVEGNFSEETRWNELLSGVQVCYHLVSTTVPKSSNDDPIADITSNVVGTLRLLDAARKQNVRVVFASSGGTVYGTVGTEAVTEDHPTDPLCSYGIGKLAIEKYLSLYRELHGLNSVVLRIANPYGEGQSPDAIQGAIGVFLGRVMRGHTIDVWGDGSVVRDYVYVRDVVDAMMAASQYGGKAKVFNVGSGAGVSLRQLIDLIQQVTGKQAEVVFHPSRGFDVPRSVLDIRRAQEHLGWSPKVPLIDGLKRTVDWMRQEVVV